MIKYLILLAFLCTAQAGTFVCNSSCFSKAASVTAVFVHIKELKAAGVKVAHPKRKTTKATK